MQYRDTDHSLQKAFGINSVPHYFTIDSNAVLTAEIPGSGTNIEGRIQKLVQHAKESSAVVASTSAGVKLPSPDR